ncbi:MAG: hypothetical protein HQL25_01955 [Candidatus Omnitrophica bacterium]|nr:hypothetical protein [Candidatus Omnitrophota bacterium]
MTDTQIKSIYPENEENISPAPTFFNIEDLTILVLPAMLGATLAYGDGFPGLPIAIITTLTMICLASTLQQFRNALDKNESIINTVMALVGLAGCLWTLFSANVDIPIYICLYLLITLITMKLERVSWLFKPLNFIRILVTGSLVISLVYYLQANELNYAIPICGLPFSLFALANLSFTTFLTNTGYLIPPIIYLLIQDHAEILFSSLLLIFASWPLSKITSQYKNDQKNNRQILFILSVLFMIIFAAGWNWPIISWYLHHPGYIPGATLLKNLSFFYSFNQS